MIGKLLMFMTGLILGMLGMLTAFHSDHMTVAVLLLFAGIMCMHQGLPSPSANAYPNPSLNPNSNFYF